MTVPGALAASTPTRSRFAATAITIVIALLAAGVEAGENFQPARVAIACAGAWVIVSGSMNLVSRSTRAFALLGWTWVLWGVLSLTWTPDVASGIRDNLRVAVGVCTVCVLAWLASRTPAALAAVRRGWIAAVTLTLPLALYEIVTDYHLPDHSYGHIESGGLHSFGVTYACVTFGNRNYYVAFLTLAYPYILWGLSRARTRAAKFLHMALAAAVALIVLVDSSRLGLIVLGIQSALWFVGGGGIKRLSRRLLFIAVAVIAGWWIIPYLPYTVLRLQWLIGGQDESVSARTGLFWAGLRMLYDTAGIGVGAGGFSQRIADTAATSYLSDPHNVWMEIATQYGVLIGLGFVAWLVACAIRLIVFIRRHQAQSGTDAYEGSYYALLVLVSLPLNGLMNSAYLSYTFFWVSLGCIALTVNAAETELTRLRRRPAMLGQTAAFRGPLPVPRRAS
jgi:hypothetical protein